MGTDDWQAIEAVCEALASRADEHGIETLSRSERAVMLPYWAKAIVDNGGLEYFFEGADNALEVAAAFDELGIEEGARAFRQSTEVFPNGEPQVSHESRRNWMDSHRAEIDAVFAKLNPIIWQVDADLAQAISEYIRAHSDELQVTD